MDWDTLKAALKEVDNYLERPDPQCYCSNTHTCQLCWDATAASMALSRLIYTPRGKKADAPDPN